MDKKLNLSTEKGCRKTLAILLCIVLLASLFAQLISTNFGSVKISTLTIDSRGAELDIDLYVSILFLVVFSLAIPFSISLLSTTKASIIVFMSASSILSNAEKKPTNLSLTTFSIFLI